MVFANSNGHGNGNGNGNRNGNGNGHGNGNGNGNRNGNGNGHGKGKGHGHGNGIGNSDENGNSNGNGNGNGNRNGNGNGLGNNRHAEDQVAGNQKSTGDASSNVKTPVIQQTVSTDTVQQIVSMPAVQAPIMALMITYPGATAVGSADGPAWWSVVESNAERLFRKFFFLSGSVGEKIRRKNVLRNRKRREIYNYVVNFPFSHFRRITRTVGVGPNEGSWHLRILEKMGLIKSEQVGRYLVYHANNSDYIGNRGNRPATIIPNSNATKILEYLLRNPGTKITHVTRGLMMNRNTVSYHIKRMQTSGLIEREETNGLRLVRTGNDHEDGLTGVIANPTASKLGVAPPQGRVLSITSSVESGGE